MKASILIVNGHCLTQDQDRTCDWIAVDGERIVALGEGETYREALSEWNVLIDAQQGTVLPGFIDSHFHVVQTALNSQCVDLGDARSFKDIGELIYERYKKEPNRPIHAIRMDIHNLKERRFPTRQDLDKICSDTPIWINSSEYQTSVLNTCALLFYKIPFTVQGVLFDDKQMPTGVFQRQANAMLRANISNQYSDFYRMDALQNIMPQVAEAGITTACAVEGGPIYCDKDAEFINEIIKRKSVYLDMELFFQTLDLDRVESMGLHRVGGCLYVDGTFSARLAAISFEYADAPGEKGGLNFTQDRMNEFVEQCYRRNLQLSLYTIGDRAIDLALRAHERAVTLTGITGLRHRLEHVELPREEHIRLAADLGVIFSMRPIYELRWGGEGKMYEKRLGEQYKNSNPFREILDGGVLLCGGTDSDVCKANILSGIHAAVNHPVEQHRVTVPEALRMFTCNGAYAIGKEDEKGYLKEKHLADIVILNGDILKTPTSKIKDLKVNYTIKSGELVYHA